MTVCCAALMCHAPIVVPEVGGARGAECARTTWAMDAVARQVGAHRPDVLVLMSPHTPRFAAHVGVFGARGLAGSFARFAAPGCRVRAAAAPEAVRRVREAAAELELPVREAPLDDLDHGAAVPLYFLQQHVPRVPVVLLSLPYPDAIDAERMGRVIRRAAQLSGQRWAVVASGDMSHRLLPDAPAGYHPRAEAFDRAFVEKLVARDYHAAVEPEPALRELAAEDVVDTTRAAFAAVGYASQGARVYAYEAPFGVGYCEALLHTDTLTEGACPAPPVLLEVAREAIAARLTSARPALPALPAPFDAPRAVFVTLRSARGELRGCIGRTEPLHDSLAAEVSDCAEGAALRDPRMAPVQPEELAELRIEVSVLSPSEPVASIAELDPARYGVVVEDERGRRGVLLPGLEGVDSADMQVAIARRKAGIDERVPVRLARFQVDKVAEPALA